MSKILLIDNYDSFTYNLYHYLEELYDGDIEIMRNDKIDFERVDTFQAAIISPGPGIPKHAGQLMLFLKKFAHKMKLLGICLGHQAIAEHFGIRLENLTEVVHGQSTSIKVLNSNSVFKSLPKTFKVGRYHSWIVDKSDIGTEIIITAKDEKGQIMAIKHKSLPIEAVQFHPESVLTEFGKEILKNWLNN